MGKQRGKVHNDVVSGGRHPQEPRLRGTVCKSLWERWGRRSLRRGGRTNLKLERMVSKWPGG